MRVNYDRLIYRIGFLAMGAGMLLYAVAGSPGGRTVALLIQICAFTYLDLVLWSFGSYLIKHLNQPAIWATCCPTASLMGGRFLGTVIGFGLLSGNVATGALALSPSNVAAILAFSIVAAALMLSSSRNVQSGWGFVRPGTPDDPAPATHELACQLIAADYSLTGREVEVLLLLAQSKTRREIRRGSLRVRQHGENPRPQHLQQARRALARRTDPTHLGQRTALRIRRIGQTNRRLRQNAVWSATAAASAF